MTRLVIFALAWATGTYLAQAFDFPTVWALLTLPATLVLFTGWKDVGWSKKARFALIGLLFGTLRMAAAQPKITPEHIAFYNDIGTVSLEGVIKHEPDHRAHVTNLRLEVESVIFPNGERQTVHGKVLLKAPAYTEANYGDRVHAVGSLQTPPEFKDFSYRDYLARQNVHALLQDAHITVLASHQASAFWEHIYRFKARTHTVLLTILPEPQASLLSGILLGIETGIPDDLNDAFVATGTSHIVAISGFNLSMIATFLIKTLKRLPKARGTVVGALLGVWLYTLFVGASAAVVRAAAMATVAIVAREKVAVSRIHGPTSLAAAVCAMLLINPYTLWDVGFQLSVMATLGLVLYTDPITQGFTQLFKHYMKAENAERLVTFLSEALIVTLAAQLTTMGVIVGVFRRLSLITLFTNLIVLPAQNYVMLTGATALVTTWFAPPLGHFAAWPAWFFLKWTTAAVRWTATFPKASVELGNITLPMVWGYYGIIFAATWWLKKPRAERQRIKQNSWSLVGRTETIVGAALLAAFFIYLYTVPDGNLHVTFLDVGQGDAIFIQTPHGKQVLIDGGPDAARTLSQLGRSMPFWDRQLDMVILTSPDDARLNGLIPVLERYTVDFVATSGESVSDPPPDSAYAHWVERLRSRPPDSVGRLAAGMLWDIDTDVTLHVLWPDPNTDGPLVLHLIYGETRFLLMGDATTVVEQTLVSRAGRDLHSTVLHVARHGAKTAGTASLLQAVSPHVAVITCRDDEDDDYPAPALLARLLETPTYRTDRHGTVEVVSDGRTIQVRTEKRNE